MRKFSTLLRFHGGASAALRVIRGYVFSTPGKLSDYDGWCTPTLSMTSPGSDDDWPDLQPQADPWLHSAETQFLPRVPAEMW